MRLSTDPGRDEADAIAVLHAALDAGVTFLDTADAYCLDDRETGHNERLIARALGSWSGDRSRIRVATKGGLTRPQGNWVADGRARHLVAACDASRRALGVDRIALYQLHAPDPSVPLSTSVRALASLQERGWIDSVGLCNVNVGQIEEARAIAEIAAVQVELSLWHDDNVLNGVARYCLDHGIRLVAHRPLGGPQRRRRTASDPLLVDLAARHRTTPFEIALAWLVDLSPAIVPVPGPTRPEHAASIARAYAVALTREDRERLDARFPAGALLRAGGAVRHVAPVEGEVVLIMGLPAAGKSTAAADLVQRGYVRLNRDEQGGSLRDLLTVLDNAIEAGRTRIVLDNTYASRQSRARVVQAAARRGLPVRCVWMSTSLEDAQVNAVSRMLARYGRLLGPDEIRAAARSDASVFGPAVLFRYQRELELPHPAEGFARIDIVPFERTTNASRIGRAVLLWCDGVLRRSRAGARTPASAEDEEVFEARGALLRRYEAEGWRLCGLGWHPEVESGTMTIAQAEAGFRRLQQRLGVALDVVFCPHAAGPPACWCRKPLPGLGVLLIERHQLDPRRCLYVGAGPQDPGFARRLGFEYRHADEFFASREGSASN